MINIQQANQKLTRTDVEKIDKEVVSHKCDTKYIVDDEQNPEWNLLKCVMCGIRMTQRKRVCKKCNKPYSGVYKLPNYCFTCSDNKTLKDFEKSSVKTGGPFYEI